MSAFLTGLAIGIAMCCGLDWLKSRRPFDAFCFWLNVAYAAISTLVWVTS